MYNVVFHEKAKKEFLKLEKDALKVVVMKIKELEKGNFSNDKPLKGKYKGKFRKRAGNYRIIYLKEDELLVVTLIRIAHRKEVY